MSKNYKIIVLDLDGTLTDSKKELSENNKNTLIKIQQKGVKIILASGRPTYGILPLAKSLKLDFFGGYVLSFNGGTIVDCKTGKNIFETVLPDELIEPLYCASKEFGCTLLSYKDAEIFCENAQDKYAQHESFLNKMPIREVESFLEEVKYALPKCLAVGEGEKVVALEQNLLEKYNTKMSIYRSEPFFLELVPLDIDKAQSLDRLLTIIGARADEMVAFGDGFNDMSMIKFAGCGVAMANAQQEVKDAADELTLSNDEDGVSLWIEQNSELFVPFSK